MKTVCDVLCVTRSALAVRKARFPDWQDGRRARQTEDTERVAAIHEHVARLPTYGCRQVWALLRRSHEMTGAPCVSAKRVYRVVRDHQLLLRRLGQRREPADMMDALPLTGVMCAGARTASSCDDESPLRVTFALDCYDREAISWAATTGSHSGDIVRDVMLAAGEQRFGTTQTGAPIEWLSDNGSAYIDHRTRCFARELGLEPLTTPVRSPQSNRMAESFVKTIKHDYIAFMHKPDVPTALSHLAGPFERYNERHPHTALKYRFPRELRRTAASST
jgi:putative transposase